MPDVAKPTCSVEDCERESVSLGLCSMHYQREYKKRLGTCSIEDCGQDAWAKGLCSAHYLSERSESAASCSVEGCDNKAYARSLCHMHAARAAQDKGIPCSVDGCEKPTRYGRYCSMHYYRVWKTGAPGEAEPRRRPARTCKVDGCVNPACGSDDLCKGHHDKMVQFGNTDGRLCECGAKVVRGLTLCREHHLAEMRRKIGNLERPPTNRGIRKLNGGGYVTYNVLGVAIHEHRAVMERVLGRLLEPFENVHHKNGRRHDNRPENLELWVTMQPTGQRPEDLVSWVVEHYPQLVREALVKESVRG